MCKEVGNVKDRYAISILQSPGVVVGHLPHKISRIFTNAAAGISHSLFLLCDKYHTGLITAKVPNHKNKVHIVKTHYVWYPFKVPP